MKPFTLCTLVLALAALPAFAESRTWTEAASGRTIDGELVSADDTTAEVRRADGKTVKLPLERLSEADREFVAANAKAMAEPGDADTPTGDDAAAPEAAPGVELVNDDNKVVLHGVHLCCGGCQDTIEEAVAEYDDVEVDVSRSSDSITISGDKSNRIIYAIDAIGKAGYYGASDHKDMKDSVPDELGTAKSEGLQVSGLHICCGKCEGSLEDALTEIEGVTGIVIEKKGGKVTIEGEASEAEALAALHKAGFNGKL